MSSLVETSRSKFSESSFCTPNWKCLSHKRVDFGPERKHTVIGFLYQYRSNFRSPGPPQIGDHHLQFYPQKHVVLGCPIILGLGVTLDEIVICPYKLQIPACGWYYEVFHLCGWHLLQAACVERAKLFFSRKPRFFQFKTLQICKMRL